jgi:hypothetical protein
VDETLSWIGILHRAKKDNELSPPAWTGLDIEPLASSRERSTLWRISAAVSCSLAETQVNLHPDGPTGSDLPEAGLREEVTSPRHPPPLPIPA